MGDTLDGCHPSHCYILVTSPSIDATAPQQLNFPVGSGQPSLLLAFVGRVGSPGTMREHGYPLSSGLSESGHNWRMNDGPVGDGSYGDDLLNQSSGDPPDAAGLAPVETKRVLVQVRSEVLTACASVIGPE